MSNSKLVVYTKWSPNHSGKRNHKIDTVTIHHMAGNLTIETCGEIFARQSRQASSNYGIGTDGRIGQYVDEANRAWTTSSPENDNRAITIEVANDEIGGNWHVSDKAYESLLKLVTDICKRNGIKKLNYTGDKTGNLTMHKWFAATACPGPYLSSKFPAIAKEVNKRLDSSSSSDSKIIYRVQTGAFQKKAYAEAMVADLKKKGFSAILKRSGTNYLVQVGAYSVLQNARNMVQKLKTAGFDAIIKTS